MISGVVTRVVMACLGIGLGAWGFMALAASPAGTTEGTNGMADQQQRRYSTSGFVITRLDDARVQELARDLTPEQRQIVLAKGTERPFCGTLLDNKKTGTYCCVLCDLPLFSSSDKFDSGTGWPSFFQPFDPMHIDAKPDLSHGMRRVEILCTRCGGHLGHVFDDGPKPTGLRFCVNSESLAFFEQGETMPPGAQPIQTATAYFGGGCFWGIEHHFQNFPGVVNVVSGYQGGHVDNPTYKQVSYENTGHAEVVRVTYDPAAVTYRQLLRAFFAMHDPTQLNRQGPDVGTQYRSIILAADETQLAEAQAYLQTLREAGTFKRPIVTEVRIADNAPFYEAEEFHQDYVLRTGRACHAMRPVEELPE